MSWPRSTIKRTVIDEYNMAAAKKRRKMQYNVSWTFLDSFFVFPNSTRVVGKNNCNLTDFVNLGVMFNYRKRDHILEKTY